MRTVYRSHFYDFALDDDQDALVFLWKPETTGTLTDNDFKEALSNFAGYGFEHKPASMVIDLRGFRPAGGAPSAEVAGQWRAAVVVPRYNAAGIKRFAYIKAPDAPGPPVGGPVRHDGEDFETAVFDSDERLGAWLKGAAA